MNRTLSYFLVAVYSVFLGSQITEGILLVPYWKSLSAIEFYEYYRLFGPVIGRFYTILTITAVLLPLGVSIYCVLNKFRALKLALVSTFFSFLVILVFYAYFKGINQQFYTASFNSLQLKAELEIWGYWHWCRVILEFLSLTFFILTLNILTKDRS